MANTNPVLVMQESDEHKILKIEYLSDTDIPDTLNGESGFHVYHVRMLTQLILTDLKKRTDAYALTDENIEAMAIASSLHDIGKLKVPKSILDFPGKLSPVEYDIVKRHSAFGEAIINDTESDIDETVLKHAKDIARYHHERYDGSGYPDGLSGDDIPISAQVVSIADSFDALTSERSYKEALSQDVAIEMIANGMCGVFNELLIESLLNVVNDKVLLQIRDNLKKSRSVVMGQNIFVPKNVLLIGNTGYVTQKFVDEIYPQSRFIVVGDTSLKRSQRVKVFKTKNPPIKRIFETYDFDVVIYFASELSFAPDKDSDAEHLRKVLKYCCENQKDVKFLYLSSLDRAFETENDRGILITSKENLCEKYRKNNNLSVKIVRIPYLYSGIKEDDFLYLLFEEARAKKSLTFESSSLARCYFMSSSDLYNLIERLIDNWQVGSGNLAVNDEFKITFGDLANKISAVTDSKKIDFKGTLTDSVLNVNNKALRTEYGWLGKISILDDIEEEYEKFKNLRIPKLATLTDKIKNWIANHTLAVKIAELFILFFLTEILMLITDSSIHFAIVDFRMAYIVIMATLHGLGFGISAAALSSISYLIAKVESGTRFITMFYEPSNWLGFVFFFLIGALCGYVKLRSDDKLSEIREQKNLTEEKLIFTRELYTDTYNEKRDLKKQIIGSKDSFGKIFDITKQLDTVEPRKLYLKIMDTFEDILENKSICVYSVNENSAFGRLEVASRDILNNVSRSVSLDKYKPILKKLQEGDVWRNVELQSGFPMYASGIKRCGKLELLIFVWHSNHQQRSLYYVNLFKILCDLVEMSLLRAFDYNQAIYESQYIKGTVILNEENFEKTFEHFKSMSDRKVFYYVLLEIDPKGHSLSEVNGMLAGKIRTNDILGLDKNGKIKLLLSQATKEDLGFILPRFESLDLDIKIL